MYVNLSRFWAWFRVLWLIRIISKEVEIEVQHIEGGESGNLCSGLGFAVDLLYRET